jgi:hypothetical protein
MNMKLALKRLAAIRFLTHEVFPADVPVGVRAALAGELVELLTGNAVLPPLFPHFENISEEELTVWGSDFAFRPLPDGSWAVVSLPDNLGDPWLLAYVIDAPEAAGPGSLPELHIVRGGTLAPL